jgi:hypothetical protein
VSGLGLRSCEMYFVFYPVRVVLISSSMPYSEDLTPVDFPCMESC